MPLPNRVRPDGTLFATSSRGLFFGNRGGRFHDPSSRDVPARTYATRQWLCCVLAFKARRRSVWGQGYTELFFCDEVTALAAGHRPCMECRRSDALAYRSALVAGLKLAAVPLFPEIDRRLDNERRRGRIQRTHRLPIAGLPDGAMLKQGDAFLALKGGQMWRWSPDGYCRAEINCEGDGDVLTPPATLAALAAGYRPIWHPSALD